MTHHSLLAAAFAAAAAVGGIPPALAAPAALSAQAVDDATYAPLPEKPGESPVPEIVKAQVLLDRARFSPGVIDGLDGDNFRHALYAYQVQMGLPASGLLDPPTWDRLTAGAPAPMRTVEVTRAEADGPFTPSIPPVSRRSRGSGTWATATSAKNSPSATTWARGCWRR